MAGAPKGNHNCKGGKMFLQALKRELARATNENADAGLERVARGLVKAAFEGEPWAIQEIANRFDGKPAQSVTVGQDEESGPIQLAVIKVPYKELHDVGTDSPAG